MTTKRGHRLRSLAVAGLAGAVASVAGCAGKRVVEDPVVETVAEPLPEAAEVLARYNARVVGLDRLWSRAVTSLTYFDDEGERRREQGDGHFMFDVASSGVALTVNAPHRTFFHFGAGWLQGGEPGSWVIDLVDEPVAYTRGASAEGGFAGLGIGPVEFLAVAGMRPIDPAGVRISGWGPGRSVWVEREREGRGVFRVAIVPETGEPVAAEVFDAAGTLVVRSELSEPSRVDVRGGGMLPPTIQTRIEVISPSPDPEGSASEARVTLSSPKIDPRRPNARVFDFAALVEQYRIEKIVDLDAPPNEGPAGANG